MTRLLRPALVLVMVLLSGLLVVAPSAAQEAEVPAAPAEDLDAVREMLDAPIPTADQSEPDWWRRTTSDWRVRPAILAAYQQFWSARRAARLAADAALLEPTTAGPLLESEQRSIEQLRRAGHAQVLEIEHNTQVWEAAADEGVVYDEYVSTTYRINARTRQEIEPGDRSPEAWSMAFRLQPVDGMWKVVDVVRIVDDAD